MENTLKDREVSISIKGTHYFGCDYIFSNVYGSAVFTDTEPMDYVETPMDDLLSDDPIKGDYSEKTLDRFIEDSRSDADIYSLPDCSKEIEYSTLGTLCSDGAGGVYIRYSGDFSPICMHISRDGRVTLNGEDDDFSELVFEPGKRNHVSLPESLFSDGPTGENVPDEEADLQSPLQLCVSTKSIDSDLTENGGRLCLSYSIEVNGITAETSDIILTANPQ